MVFRVFLFLALCLCIDARAYAQDHDSASEVSVPPANLRDAQVQAIGCFDENGKIEHQSCTIATSFDLTNVYHTTSKWQFVIIDDQNAHNGATSPTQNICFIEDGKPSCGYDLMNNHTVYNPAGFHTGPEDGYAAATAAVVYPTLAAKFPLLILTTACEVDRCGYATMIWAYHPQLHKFEQIWFNSGCGCHLDYT